MKLIWTKQSIEDLVEARSFVEEHNPKAAAELAKRILRAAERLHQNPNLGRMGRLRGTRELIVPKTPYLIPYRIHQNRVELLRVFHGRRQYIHLQTELTSPTTKEVSMLSDTKFNRPVKTNCRKVRAAEIAFDAHSSPLGFEYFGDENNYALSGYFLAGLHGSTKKSLNHGYRVVRLRGRDKLSGAPEDFIDGFLRAGKVNGRPVDILSFGKDAFLLTDDYAGVVYYVHAK